MLEQSSVRNEDFVGDSFSQYRLVDEISITVSAVSMKLAIAKTWCGPSLVNSAVNSSMLSVRHSTSLIMSV